MPHLFNFKPEELADTVSSMGEKLVLAQARKILAHTIGHGQVDFQLKHPLRKSLQKFLENHFPVRTLKVLERIEDPSDKSLRYLFECEDGALVEAVRIPLHKPGHYSVCLSSQAGCAMACDFCATGRLGLKRHLETWEMIAQLWQIKKELEILSGIETDGSSQQPSFSLPAGRISGAVFMGQGEPFHNYDNVIKAAQIISSPCGLSIDSKNITISTVGLIPQIKRYTEENHPYRLIISLTSALTEKRASMLPVAGKWSLKELAAAIKDYSIKRRERVTLAWVLIKGFNSGRDEVEALKEMMGDIPYKLNLIDVNDARDNGYQRADDVERKSFQAFLQELHVPVVRRYSVGNSSHSACGMLAGKRLHEM